MGRAPLSWKLQNKILKFVKMQMANWFTFEFKDIQAEGLFTQNWWITCKSRNKWKQFIYHMGRTRDRYSIEDAGLVAGGKESKEGRQAIFLTPLDPYHSDASEAAISMDLSKPRKVHYQTHWKPEQDAVYWVNLSMAQDCGLKFWQTQSHAIIVYHSLPKERVEKVVTEQGGRQLFSRQLTFRPGPIVTPKNFLGEVRLQHL